jgi:hypothetical protein
MTHFDKLMALLKAYEEEDGTVQGDSFIRDPEMLTELAMLAEHEGVESALKGNVA